MGNDMYDKNINVLTLKTNYDIDACVHTCIQRKLNCFLL